MTIAVPVDFADEALTAEIAEDLTVVEKDAIKNAATHALAGTWPEFVS